MKYRSAQPCDLSSVHSFVTALRKHAGPALIVAVEQEEGLAFVGWDAQDVSYALGVDLDPEVNELVFASADVPRVETALLESRKRFVVARRKDPKSEFQVERIVVEEINESFAPAVNLPLNVPADFRLLIDTDAVYIGLEGAPITGCELLFEWEGRLERYRCDLCEVEARTEQILSSGTRRFAGTVLYRDGGQPMLLSREGTRLLSQGLETRIPHAEINTYRPPRTTPWGEADTFRRVGEGVSWVCTPSHGGLFLPHRLARQLATALGQPEGVQGSALQWFEEDIAWSIPVVVFPRLFSDHEIFRAAEVQRSQFGDQAVRAFIQTPPAAEFRRRLATVSEAVRTSWRVTMVKASSKRKECMWKVDVRHMATREERSVITATYPPSEFLTADQFARLGPSLLLPRLTPAPVLTALPAPQLLAIA